MRHFWTGFEMTKTSAPVRFKKHVIVLYWSSEDDRGREAKKAFGRIAVRHPSVAVKTVDRRGRDLPSVVLLKDGRETDRLSMENESSLLEHLFRKASV
jgi:hypothetical protein